MLQEPHVQVLARHLQSCIDEVLGSRAVREARAEPGVSPAEPVKPAVTAAPKTAEAAPPRVFALATVSASSREALQRAAERLASQLEEDAGGELDDPGQGSSLPAAGPDLAWRRAVVGAGREEMAERLKKGSGKGSWSGAEPAVRRPVAFLLAGVGEQVAGSGRGLYEGEPVFRDAADESPRSCGRSWATTSGTRCSPRRFPRASGCEAMPAC